MLRTGEEGVGDGAWVEFKDVADWEERVGAGWVEFKDVEDWEEGVAAGWLDSRLGCEVPSPAQRERVRVRAARAVISSVFWL